jgi:UDP-GlcNAc:undecaprenyl-phosphate/decaprenyl-phosphate GlcNAc-1-phosphate transferase
MDLILNFLLVLFLSFSLSIILNSIVLKYARKYSIYDVPNKRSSHLQLTPRLGGLVFFFIFLIGTLTLSVDLKARITILVGSTMLLLVGLFDDLRSVSPRFKLIVQIMSIVLLTWFYSDSIEVFRTQSVFHIIHADLFLFLVTSFFLVFLNAVNLIDGINGLAALISLNFFICSTFFFYQIGCFSNAFESLMIIGSILAFLFFNFSKNRKLFMGDSGSLLLAFVTCSISLEMIHATCCLGANNQFTVNQLTLLLVALFSYPIFDLFRVIFIRVKKRTGIFQADRNHLHHFFIDKLKKSHVFSSISLAALHMLLILTTYFFIS